MIIFANEFPIDLWGEMPIVSPKRVCRSIHRSNNSKNGAQSANVPRCLVHHSSPNAPAEG